MAVNRADFDAAVAAQPPPEGMAWLRRYAEAPESRQLMMMLPNWREMNEWRHSFISAARQARPLRGQIIPLHTTSQFVTIRRPRLGVFSAPAVCQ